MGQLTDIKCHVEMMATDRMKKHAMTGPEGDHDLPFQVFRYLSGYDEALARIEELEEQVRRWKRSSMSANQALIDAQRVVFETIHENVTLRKELGKEEE